MIGLWRRNGGRQGIPANVSRTLQSPAMRSSYRPKCGERESPAGSVISPGRLRYQPWAIYHLVPPSRSSHLRACHSFALHCLIIPLPDIPLKQIHPTCRQVLVILSLIFPSQETCFLHSLLWTRAVGSHSRTLIVQSLISVARLVRSSLRSLYLCHQANCAVPCHETEKGKKY